MKQLNCLRGLFLLCLLMLIPGNMVQAAGNIQVADTLLTQEEGSLKVAFSIENTSNTENEIKYGIRVQSLEGADAYEVPVDKVVLKVGESRILYMTVPLPTFIQGPQDVFVLSRDAQGLVSVLKYAGEIDIDSKKESDAPKLEQCETNTESIICDIVNIDEDSVNIQYSINKGSAYGPSITSGVANGIQITEGKVSLILPVDMSGGDYTYALWLADKVDAQRVVVHIEEELIIVDEASNNGVSSNKGRDYAKFFVIIAPILLLIALMYIAIRRPKTLLLIVSIVGFSTVSIAVAAITLTDTDPAAHIFSGFSQDSNTVQFAITLDDAEVQTVDTIGFSVVFQNVELPNNKPSGGSIDINIDGGTWQQLITTSDTGSIYHKTTAAIATPGTYTLNFRSPDLCGGVFGLSIFNFSIFGATECLFSVDVVVVQNDPPTAPSIGGNCILGESCSIGIVSTDTDGGQLCYEVDWPTGSNTNAGCAIENNPVSVTRTFNSCDTADTTVRAQATDAQSETSTWGSSVVGCTEPCTHCIYDGTAGSVSISATPPFIPPTGTVDISWSLTNVKDCSIEVYDIAAEAVVDTWDWDFVRLNDSKQVTGLSVSTRYTLDCTDLADDPAEAQVTVVTVPTWQEF